MFAAPDSKPQFQVLVDPSLKAMTPLPMITAFVFLSRRTYESTPVILTPGCVYSTAARMLYQPASPIAPYGSRLGSIRMLSASVMRNWNAESIVHGAPIFSLNVALICAVLG